jgi:hypothetical protein
VARAVGVHNIVPPPTTLSVLFLLTATYLGSFAARTLIRSRTVLPFEIVQTAVVLAVGLGGGVIVARVTGVGNLALGLASAVLGVGCYAVAFAFDRRQAARANVHFYATLALVLTLGWIGLLLPGPVSGLGLAALALLATWLGRSRARLALAIHGAAYAVAAAGASGLATHTVAALASTPRPQPPDLAVASWAALAAPAVCLAISRPVRQSLVAALPRVAYAMLLVVTAGGTVLALLAPAIAGTPPAPGPLATLRTTVLAAAAVILAIATRYERTVELGSLLYPVLLIGAVKLVLDDFRHSQPATLFVALAVYGAALILAPRLAAQRKSDADRAPA